MKDLNKDTNQIYIETTELVNNFVRKLKSKISNNNFETIKEILSILSQVKIEVPKAENPKEDIEGSEIWQTTIEELQQKAEQIYKTLLNTQKIKDITNTNTEAIKNILTKHKDLLNNTEPQKTLVTYILKVDFEYIDKVFHMIDGDFQNTIDIFHKTFETESEEKLKMISQEAITASDKNYKTIFVPIEHKSKPHNVSNTLEPFLNNLLDPKKREETVNTIKKNFAWQQKFQTTEDVLRFLAYISFYAEMKLEIKKYKLEEGTKQKAKIHNIRLENGNNMKSNWLQEKINKLINNKSKIKYHPDRKILFLFLHNLLAPLNQPARDWFLDKYLIHMEEFRVKEPYSRQRKVFKSDNPKNLKDIVSGGLLDDFGIALVFDNITQARNKIKIARSYLYKFNQKKQRLDFKVSDKWLLKQLKNKGQEHIEILETSAKATEKYKFLKEYVEEIIDAYKNKPQVENEQDLKFQKEVLKIINKSSDKDLEKIEQEIKKISDTKNTNTSTFPFLNRTIKILQDDNKDANPITKPVQALEIAHKISNWNLLNKCLLSLSDKNIFKWYELKKEPGELWETIEEHKFEQEKREKEIIKKGWIDAQIPNKANLANITNSEKYIEQFKDSHIAIFVLRKLFAWIGKEESIKFIKKIKNIKIINHTSALRCMPTETPLSKQYKKMNIYQISNPKDKISKIRIFGTNIKVDMKWEEIKNIFENQTKTHFFDYDKDFTTNREKQKSNKPDFDKIKIIKANNNKSLYELLETFANRHHKLNHPPYKKQDDIKIAKVFEKYKTSKQKNYTTRYTKELLGKVEEMKHTFLNNLRIINYTIPKSKDRQDTNIYKLLTSEQIKQWRGFRMSLKDRETAAKTKIMNIIILKQILWKKPISYSWPYSWKSQFIREARDPEDYEKNLPEEVRNALRKQIQDREREYWKST